MPDPAIVKKVVRQWVLKAEHDLTAARLLLRSGADCPPDAVCFHAQQGTEKYLKARLVLEGIRFERTHDVKTLVALLPSALRPKITPGEQNLMSGYAVVVRYPGESGEDEETIGEARAAVRIARRVRADIRRGMPKDCLTIKPQAR